MNYIIDIIILLCLGWGAYKGFTKGFITQSFTILSIAFGIWGGFTFAGQVEPLLENWMNDLACSIVSFIIVFIVVLLLVLVSGFLVTKLANATALGMLNRLAGAAFGILANALILSIIILFFNRMNDNERFVEKQVIDETYLYEPIGKVATVIFPDRFFTNFTIEDLPL